MNGWMIFWGIVGMLALLWGKAAYNDLRVDDGPRPWIRLTIAGICVLLALDGLFTALGI